MIEHDRLFKAVLKNFFVEFVELFLPEMAKYMDMQKAAPHPVDKELFGRERKGRSSQVDVLMKARTSDDSPFLVHIEAQATPQTHFSLRLLKYYILLQEEYKLPVYPVALFSFAGSKKEEVGSLLGRFPDREVLKFEYAVIQLNLLDWRRYADKNNPVAAAFMAKMRIAQKDRPHVKLKCVTMLLGLKLESHKQRIISEFIDTYLRLSEDEDLQYESELHALSPQKREEVMPVRMSWKEQGKAEGKAEGRWEGALTVACSLLDQRFGELEPSILAIVHGLSAEQLKELSLAIRDFSNVSDLEIWLASTAADTARHQTK